MLAPSTLTPGNLPTITSANEVAPGEIPNPELINSIRRITTCS